MSPVPTPISPPHPTTKCRNSKSTTSSVSTPISPPRLTIKCPRRGSRLNLNAIVAPSFVLATLPDNDTPTASMDEQPDVVLSKEMKARKSKSMVSKERNNKLAASGLLVKSTQRWDNYVAKLRQLDQHVEVYGKSPTRIRQACCSSCAKIILQSEPYNTYRFKQHISRCKAKGSKLHVQSIDSIFKFKLDRLPSTKPKVDNLVKRPCRGLTKAHDECIPVYTSRTEVRYAGRESRTILAIRYFGQTFRFLSE
ncbi:hypothetical protein BDN71DRAFT_1506912 [Pleurotus eryngii]|uniref:Uncharacterized protein n=1 Tax=Pleurotus eryngii TaxID=5323 RepID=A0A9P5ZXA2_PLEER|nr:hypothetical protein BDN71DRAFT_1506912 [Pleurotus eryngii]